MITVADEKPLIFPCGSCGSFALVRNVEDETAELSCGCSVEIDEPTNDSRYLETDNE